MNLDIDFLIEFYKKYTKNISKGEFSEQDAAAAPSGGSGKTPKKWESGRKFGKTYMNDPKYVWNSDVIRGKGNSLYYG
jgi:hypothetical protein